MIVLLLLSYLVVLNFKAKPSFLINLNSHDENLIINEVKFEKCWFNCRFEDYEPIEVATNTFSHWYLLVKYHNINQSSKILVDISFTPIENESGYIVEEDVLNNQKAYKKYLVNTPDTIDENLALIRSIDVLYGNDDFHDYRSYWNAVPFPSLINSDIYPFVTTMKLSNAQQNQYNHDNSELAKLKNLNLLNLTDSRFKILQLSDLHFGLNKGHCLENNCKSDLRTLKFIDSVIIDEKPNFIIITGDLFDLHRLNSPTSGQMKSIIIKSLQPILQHNIPFIITFGESEFNAQANIDDFKLSILEFLSTIPDCYNSIPIDSSLHGKTNYNLQVYNRDKSQHGLITILDTEANQLQESQINSIYRENPADYKLMFFHYPIPQFRPLGKFKIVGDYNEKHPLISNTNKKFLGDIIKCGYNVLSVGHEHENDACILQELDGRSIWLCYSGITGDSGETKLNQEFERRVRMFEINWNNKQLLSWKIKEGGAKFDYQLVHKLT